MSPDFRIEVLSYQVEADWRIQSPPDAQRHQPDGLLARARTGLIIISANFGKFIIPTAW
jgi:hypothetical protein